MTLTFEANRQFLSLRLGRWEFLAIREAGPLPSLCNWTRVPGGVTLDVPGLSLQTCCSHNVC
jgi:hypothetical protein